MPRSLCRPVIHHAALLVEPAGSADAEWTWILDTDVVQCGSSPSALEAGIAGIIAVLGTLPCGDLTLLTHAVQSPGVVSTIRSAVTGSRVTVVPSSFPSHEIQRIRALARGEDPSLAQSVATIDKRRLLIGTDGSSRKFSRNRSGWAWVAADGTYRAGLIRSGIQAAEMVALDNAFTAVPARHRPATLVMSDSRPALDQWRRLYSGTAYRDCAQWIPGHTGHPLNEAADRLARLARRCAEAGVAFNKDIADRIVSEMHQDIVSAPASIRDLHFWRKRRHQGAA